MPSKAIILASGIGKRLMPLTKETPKCLIDLGGVTILERIIESLRENKVNDIIITTGHLEEKIKDFMKNKYPEIDITYVKNPLYDKTDYIYSLWLAKEHSKDNDIILLHGDLVYDFKLMENIVKENKSSVLIKEKGDSPKKDFKARIENGLVSEIGVNVFGDNAKFCAPLYKFSKMDFQKLLAGVEDFVKNDKVNHYIEDAFNAMPNKIKLYPFYHDKEFCLEIDDFEDLEKAKNIFK